METTIEYTCSECGQPLIATIDEADYKAFGIDIDDEGLNYTTLYKCTACGHYELF